MDNQDYLISNGPKRPSSSPFTKLLKSLKLKASDLPFIAICLGAAIYFTVNDPLFMAVLGCTSILCLSLWHINRCLPILEKWLGTKIRFWHIASIILSITAVLSLLGSPAHAIFLSNLEEFFTTLAQGAGGSVNPTVIPLIFNLIRGGFLLLVAGASLFAFNQAQQGNDWRPIISQVAIAFAIVIAVDIITFLFTG